MKKVLAFIVALLPLLACAQSFVLTPNGFVNADDTTKSYIVVNVEGTQAELFQKAKTAVTSMWNSPKDVLSFNEPDIIIVNGVATDLLSIKMIVTVPYDLPYRLQLQFKDGRVRIDAPSATKAVNIERRSDLYLSAGKNGAATFYFWNRKGELKQEKNKQKAEDYFNALISTIINKLKNGAAQEDW